MPTHHENHLDEDDQIASGVIESVSSGPGQHRTWYRAVRARTSKELPPPSALERLSSVDRCWKPEGVAA